MSLVSSEPSTSSKEKENLETKNANMLALQKSGFKLQFLQKLTEIDRNYKLGVLEYKENIQAYNIEIEKLKNKIALASEYCDKEEKNILILEHELLFENRAYEKLQAKFSEYINAIDELKSEYQEMMDKERYEATLRRKEKEILLLVDDIEVSELTLLNKELLRLNILETFEPKQLELKELKTLLKELEMEKMYFESMGLDKVSNVQLKNKNFWNKEEREVVDTVEIEHKD